MFLPGLNFKTISIVDNDTIQRHDKRQWGNFLHQSHWDNSLYSKLTREQARRLDIMQWEKTEKAQGKSKTVKSRTGTKTRQNKQRLYLSGKGQFLCETLICGTIKENSADKCQRLPLLVQFQLSYAFTLAAELHQVHVYVHILRRHYVMCPIFRSFWTLLRMIVCPTRFLATARFGSRCKMLEKARCDIRSRCCLVWILLALLFEGKFTRKETRVG